ncbi:NAD-dependent protein deacetylase [Actinospica durhamensis]|uniref:NAD-dependent protein deacetylase n=1 Tax=Actinospica durhamensis TaxID=1508375 RepID=A0A941ERM7_9ACTN|nr:NAD-dependent protein deacetylase [Actinospica durhamensis]MBR7833844.1 NAD-dependent protein deacetylase [Actinospica durhamensis]
MRVRPLLDWPDSAASGQGADAGPAAAALDEVARLLEQGPVAVLSGAGLSTDSGIPDYRGVTGTLRRHTPMTYQEFVSSELGRRRYWARSHLGWRTITGARPNSGHAAVAALGASGHVAGVITQNVDGLHTAAGTRDPIELHGSLARVICLDCHSLSTREALDLRLRRANPDFQDLAASRINPDGDVELDDDAVAGFDFVPCDVCGGMLKPDVVFFGENVPKPKVARCYALVDDAHAVLVLGSSLTVMSGLRFVRYAAKAAKPVAIINQGPTRGDAHAAVRLEAPLGPTLTALAARLA